MMLSRNIHCMSASYFDGTSPQEKRKGGRFTLEGAHSDLGRVLDLSHCGAMIAKRRFRRSPAREAITLTIRHSGEHVTLRARVAREGKVEGVGWVFGLEFLDVTPTQRDAISEIIRRSRPWFALPQDQDAA